MPKIKDRRKLKLAKKCIECGITFKGNIKQKFCTKKCWNINWNKINPNKRAEYLRDRMEAIRSDPKKLKVFKFKVAKLAQAWRDKNREKVRSDGRKRNGTGVDGEGDVLFYGYKEPLRKFEGGFGYKGVISYSKDKDRIQCHFCGKLFKSINNGHLMKIHGMTASDYKQKVELSPTASLVGEGTRKKLLDRPYNPMHMEELKKAWKKRKAHIKKTGKDSQSHPKMRLEIKNKRGTCPDQLLDIIEKTIKSFGRVPTMEEFKNFHGGKFYGSIRATYGTWTNALAKLGKNTHHKEFTTEQLVDAIKNFYKVNKRTPRWSDFERGLLPSSTAYYNHFKNLNHARLLAGAPLIVQMGRYRQEYKPKKYDVARMLANIDAIPKLAYK